MPFPTSYTGWIELLRDWVDVDDLIDAQIETSLSLAQLRLNKECDSQWIESSAAIPVVTGGLPLYLPTEVPDYDRVRLVVSSGNNLPLTGLSLVEFQKLIAASTANGLYTPSGGLPYAFNIEGQNLNVFPAAAAGSTLTLYYYREEPEITSAASSNVWTDHHPDLLISASVLEISKFIVEDERIPTWENSYQSQLNSANLNAQQARLGMTPLKRNITMYAGTSN